VPQQDQVLDNPPAGFDPHFGRRCRFCGVTSAALKCGSENPEMVGRAAAKRGTRHDRKDQPNADVR